MGGILVIYIYIQYIYIYIQYIYIYTVYITRLTSNEIFLPSNKIHQEVGRAKDLSAPRYLLWDSVNPVRTSHPNVYHAICKSFWELFQYSLGCRSNGGATDVGGVVLPSIPDPDAASPM